MLLLGTFLAGTGCSTIPSDESTKSKEPTKERETSEEPPDPSAKVDLGKEVKANGIGGKVVNNESGKAEAGVWVIAETDELPTHYRKIVVTDDQGRFIVPELPGAAYKVWVRGYGLRDSKPVKVSPGEVVKLEASSASSPQKAAQIYPANYWLSLYEPPAESELPDTFESQDHWIAQFKLGCMLCHQIGGKPTRKHTSKKAIDDWLKRAGLMDAHGDALGREVLLESLADWGSRIEEEVVPETPDRPSGIERNAVITQWQWATKTSYIHDEVSTDKRDPTVNAGGPVYGVDIGQDYLWILNPSTHSVSKHKVPTRGDWDTPWAEQKYGLGSWEVYDNPANPHNPMMDAQGKVWITSQIRNDLDIPDFAKDDPVIAENFHHRQVSVFNPETQEFTLIDTAFGTHHLQFDLKGKIWFSGDSHLMGTLDPSKLDLDDPKATEAQAQDWFEQPYTEEGKPLHAFLYGIAVNYEDGTIWAASTSANGPTNRIVKFDPETEKMTNYELPVPGRGPRGVDTTSDGMVWFATGSGHLGRFNPETEEFSYWEAPGPKIRGTGDETGVADFYYYIWTDQFNTLGLGKDMVMMTGTNSDAIVVFDPETEEFYNFRVPYPLGMFFRGLDGRIDDPDAGWKGRGLWFNYGGDPIRFTEDTQEGYVNHLQLRPDPLAQ